MTVLAANAQEPKAFQFSLVDGRLSDGPQKIQVLQGDRVELVWRSDKAVEIHMHGYDIVLKVMPGESAAMTIDCTATGRFPVTLHHKGSGGHGNKPLAYFEVHPR